jgi:hypothetical protein
MQARWVSAVPKRQEAHIGIIVGRRVRLNTSRKSICQGELAEPSRLRFAMEWSPRWRHLLFYELATMQDNPGGVTVVNLS